MSLCCFGMLLKWDNLGFYVINFSTSLILMHIWRTSCYGCLRPLLEPCYPPQLTLINKVIFLIERSGVQVADITLTHSSPLSTLQHCQTISSSRRKLWHNTPAGSSAAFVPRRSGLCRWGQRSRCATQRHPCKEDGGAPGLAVSAADGGLAVDVGHTLLAGSVRAIQQSIFFDPR